MDHTYIALLRGINVGGRNKLPMNDLKAVLTGLGLQDIHTYIQSGNVVFQAADQDLTGLSSRISAAVAELHGFSPHILILNQAEFADALRRNPFKEAESEPKTLHLYFLSKIPKDPDFVVLNQLKTNRENYSLTDHVFYLHAPDGIGRSKLAARAEKALGVPVTARNWRTVQKIAAIAGIQE